MALHQWKLMKNGVILKQGSFSNVVVANGSVLVSRLVAGQTVKGITHLAVGRGNWIDLDNPPDPDPETSALADEIGRKAASFIGFENFILGEYTPSLSPTKYLRFDFQLLDGEADEENIVELGLFGTSVQTSIAPGLFAMPSQVTDQGLMFNYKTFTPIFKPVGSELHFILRISF